MAGEGLIQQSHWYRAALLWFEQKHPPTHSSSKGLATTSSWCCWEMTGSWGCELHQRATSIPQMNAELNGLWGGGTCWLEEVSYLKQGVKGCYVVPGLFLYLYLFLSPTAWVTCSITSYHAVPSVLLSPMAWAMCSTTFITMIVLSSCLPWHESRATSFASCHDILAHTVMVGSSNHGHVWELKKKKGSWNSLRVCHAVD